MNFPEHNELNFFKFIEKICYYFADDILVYSANMEEHIIHLKVVFEVSEKNELRVKLSKWKFGQNSVGFLRCIISGLGEIKSNRRMMTIKNIKQLRGFLSFVGYAKIAAPMTELLKKNVFN